MKIANALLAVAVAARRARAASCSSVCSAGRLQEALPPTAQILSAVHVEQGGSYGEGRADVAYPTDPTALPELCALVVHVTSSPVSSYRFGVFLPTRWNARFLAVGNGGFAGGINWLDMGSGVRYGHAVVSTDTGHNSTAGDVSWALANPERKKDFGYRALHGSVELGKRLVEAFYAAPIAFSYYAGGSTGGRQGLKEAQIAPASFDGLLIGAPAWWTSHLQPWTTQIGASNLPTSAPRHVPPGLFAVVGAEVTRQCDALDGLADGIVSYPDLCAFDVAPLLCGATNSSSCSSSASSSSCLTPAQAATVLHFYADYYPEGRFAFHGMAPGSEAQWVVLLGGSEPSSLGYGYVQYFLYDDPAWSWTQYNDSILWQADAEDPGDATADDYAALAALRDRGGKVLMYHGLADALIPPGSSFAFYERVAAALRPGGKGNDSSSSSGGGNVSIGTEDETRRAEEDLQDWFRFFPVPGMQHVVGTAVGAPWYFAGANAAGALGTDVYSTPGFEDARHDALLALMDWVEKGVAVDEIVATAWVQPMDPGSGVLRQRPLCPYPQKQTYDGKGDPDEPDSFSCQ